MPDRQPAELRIYSFLLSGEVHIAPILEKWRENDLTNGCFDWVNYGMELFNEENSWEGTMKITDFETQDNWKTGKYGK